MQICCNFDVANLQRYCAGFAPMLFQWFYSHMKHFSLQIHCNFFTVQFFCSRPLFYSTVFVLQHNFSCSNWLGTAVCIAADCTAVCFSNR